MKTKKHTKHTRKHTRKHTKHTRKHFSIRHKRINKTRLIKKKRHIQRGGNAYNLSSGRKYIYVDHTFDGNNPVVLSEQETVDQVNTLVNNVVQYDGERCNVAVLSGCFCPPHKGHYEYIKNVCVELNINILFLDSTNKSSGGRHGIPGEFSIEQLCVFAKEINDTQGANIFVSHNDIPYSITNAMTKLYLTSGFEIPKDEELLNKGMSKEEALRKKMNDKDLFEQKDPLERASRIFLKNFERSTDLHKQEKVQNVGFIRDESDGLSATKLTKCLIKIRDNGGRYDECFYFLPDFYTDEMKHNYINQAMKYKDNFK